MGRLPFHAETTIKRAAWRAKPTPSRPKPTHAGAFMFLEMLVVVALGMAFMFVAFSYVNSLRPRCGCQRISCVNNLKQAGTAYRIWANDNGDVFPAFASITNGGWKELLAGPNAGAFCWTNYTIMQNEFGQSPRVVVCPEDDRPAATNFNPGTFNNLTLSYFVGAEANADRPESILGGDRNLTDRPPGSKSKKSCGFSPPKGQGNDVLVNGPISWTKALHSKKKPSDAGNILLGDGSVQQVTSAALVNNYLQPALDAAEARAGATASVGLRLIFP